MIRPFLHRSGAALLTCLLAALILNGPLRAAAAEPAEAAGPGNAGQSGQAAATTDPAGNRLTGTARLLAGVDPAPGDPLIDRLAALDVWKQHRAQMQAQWTQVQARLQAMSQWRSQEVRLEEADARTLLYPFSGPDFLNAHSMFPSHGRYVFFSLENCGTLPDLEALSQRQFSELLESMREALRDIFERNYFITDYMSKQLNGRWVKGSVPVIAAMMALTDQHILRIEPVDLFPELTRAYTEPGAARPRKLLRGARIEFAGAGAARTQSLYYFSLDATDKALAFYPEFMHWVGQNQPATAFLKSASYLLHDNQFSQTRQMLLDSADTLVQDDTGVPYRTLRSAGWQIKLYGNYDRPIRSLSYGFQPDLMSAYTQVHTTTPLPFPFGYQWRNGKASLIVATREHS